MKGYYEENTVEIEVNGVKMRFAKEDAKKIEEAYKPKKVK